MGADVDRRGPASRGLVDERQRRQHHVGSDKLLVRADVRNQLSPFSTAMPTPRASAAAYFRRTFGVLSAYPHIRLGLRARWAGNLAGERVVLGGAAGRWFPSVGRRAAESLNVYFCSEKERFFLPRSATDCPISLSIPFFRPCGDGTVFGCPWCPNVPLRGLADGGALTPRLGGEALSRRVLAKKGKPCGGNPKWPCAQSGLTSWR